MQNLRLFIWVCTVKVPVKGLPVYDGLNSDFQKIFFLFSTKSYVVGTQKYRFNATVLLSIQNMCLTDG